MDIKHTDFPAIIKDLRDNMQQILDTALCRYYEEESGCIQDINSDFYAGFIAERTHLDKECVIDIADALVAFWFRTEDLSKQPVDYDGKDYGEEDERS